MDLSEAEKQLREMLLLVGMSDRKSYSASEVCKILGIGRRTFNRMILNAVNGNGKKQDPILKSYLRHNERRVDFDELASYIERNNSFMMQNGL